MKSRINRRMLLGLTTAVALAGPGIAASSAQADLLGGLGTGLLGGNGVNLNTTVGVGDLHVYALGITNIDLNSPATVGIHLNVLPLLTSVTPKACPNGETGVLANVSTLVPVTGDVTVATGLGIAEDIPVNVGALANATVGACVSVL
jgi:hypothetical protein